MALLMHREAKKLEQERAEKLEKLQEDKEPRPVLIQNTQLSKSGELKMEFNQPLEIPSMFQGKEGKRRLVELLSVNPTLIFEVNMHLLSDVSPRDLSYSMQFKEWTERVVKIQIEFNDPLLLSSGPTADKLSVKILKPELFVSQESGVSLSLEQASSPNSQISIPSQLPKGVSEEAVTKTAVIGKRGAAIVAVTQIIA